MQHSPGPTRDYSTYIGGSKIAALMGVNPWADSLDVYNQIVNKERIEPNYKMKWGIWSERDILKRVVEDTGLDFQYPGTMTVPGHDYLGATPDAIEYTATVQLKTMGPLQFMSPDWGPDGSSYVPTHVFYQANWEAGVFRDCLGRQPSFARIVAWCMEWRMHIVEFDESLYELCKEEAIRFWHDHVLPEKPPVRAKPEAQAEWVEVEGYAPLIERYLELREEERIIQEEKKELSLALRRAAEHHGIETSVGTARVLESKGRVNWNALAKDLMAAGFLTRNTLETYRGPTGHRIEVRAKRD